MSQFLSKVQQILSSLTTQYLNLKKRLDLLEKRITDNESFTYKQMDEKDKAIEKLVNDKVAALEQRIIYLEGRIRELEKPVFKPTIPHRKPVPPLTPWNPIDPLDPWKPLPSIPSWPQYPPAVPVDPYPSIPTAPIQPYCEPQTWCSKCGLNQKNASGYCCMRVDCPSKAVSTCELTTTVMYDNTNDIK
jgi:hypothetical protein